MLLNKKESIPEKFYIFVNQLNPMTHNNFNITKTFVSAAYAQCSMFDDFSKKYLGGQVNYLPFGLANEQDLKVVSPFHLSAINDYMTEYNAELARKYNFPLYPSRLSATFAFGDYETCQEVSKKYGWSLSEIREFKLTQKNPFVRVIKVNMEIVSLARYANKISSNDQQTINKIWNSYWSGEGEIRLDLPDIAGKRQIKSSGEIWEYLIEGAVVAID